MFFKPKNVKICTKTFELLVTNVVKCIVYLLCAYDKVNQKKCMNA